MKIRKGFALILFAAAWACEEDPVEVTRPCPPRLKAAIVYGTVFDQNTQGVVGATVLVQGALMEPGGECPGTLETWSDTVSDSDGKYREKLFSVFGDSLCVDVEAEADGAQGSTRGALVELRHYSPPCTPDSSLDSVRVSVVLGN